VRWDGRAMGRSERERWDGAIERWFSFV
jgi:hypothetical protein